MRLSVRASGIPDAVRHHGAVVALSEGPGPAILLEIGAPPRDARDGRIKTPSTGDHEVVRLPPHGRRCNSGRFQRREKCRLENAAAVGTAKRALIETLRVGHHAEHAAGLAGDAGNVALCAIRVGVCQDLAIGVTITERHAAFAFQPVEGFLVCLMTSPAR